MTTHIKRRAFITLLGGAAAAWPRVARAQQQSAMPVIGFLSSDAPGSTLNRVRAFHQGLGEAGYVEGRNVAIQYRWAETQLQRLPALAADLVRLPATIITAFGNAAVLAAKAASATVPIVFQTGADPVGIGLVASMNRPGGNLTGVTSLNLQLGPKRLEVLRELDPSATVFALLNNPANSVQTEIESRNLQAAARVLGVELHIVLASSERTTLVQLGARGLVVAPDALFNSRGPQLATLAARHAMPVIYPFHENTIAGGLMSYGGSFVDQYRLVGGYTGRILKGEKPADLPVQQATRVELIINLKTARALGVAFPTAHSSAPTR
jgi:putative ABC transport system substrate-binding protein